MNKTVMTLGLGLGMGLAGAAQAQIFIIGGSYTADFNCVARTNADIDAILAARASYLERGATVTPAGTHPYCSLALHYDQINIAGIPQTLHPDEHAEIIIDLKPKATFTCPNAVGAPLMNPSTKVSFITLMHQNDASFVAQSRAAFGYNAFQGYVIRNHNVGSTGWNASPVNPGFLVWPGVPDASNQLSFQTTFHNRAALNATGLVALPHLAAALDAPVFGNLAAVPPLPGLPAWNIVKWNANATTVQSQRATFNWSSSFQPFVANPNLPGLNDGDPVGAVHFENTPFISSLPVNCTSL
jgi:hypothetical protein